MCMHIFAERTVLTVGADGASEGEKDGATEGDFEGSNVGVVGASVGAHDGSTEGAVGAYYRNVSHIQIIT